MPNFWYKPGLELFAKGQCDWEGDDIRLFCVNTEEYHAAEDHRTLSEIPRTAVVAEGAITERDCTDGRLSGKPPVFEELAGPPIGAVVVAKVTSPIETSRLLMYMDEGSRLPLIPSGAQTTFFWQGDVIGEL